MFEYVMIVQIEIVVNNYLIEYNLILLMKVFLDKHIQLFELNFYAIDQVNELFDEVIHLILDFLFDLLLKKNKIKLKLKKILFDFTKLINS